MKKLCLLLCLFSNHASAASTEEKIGQTIDSWHKAAADAKEEEYFSFFTKDGIFIGTDATERWTKDEFRKYAHPFFAKGKAWTMVSKKRFISLSQDKKTAWFDESIDSKGLGLLRGSGVLVKVMGEWKIAQYNLATPIPNEKFAEVRKLIGP